MNLQQKVLEQLDLHMEKTDLNPNIEINLKWVTDLNVKIKTIKLTENLWEKTCVILGFSGHRKH